MKKIGRIIKINSLVISSLMLLTACTGALSETAETDGTLARFLEGDESTILEVTVDRDELC